MRFDSLNEWLDWQQTLHSKDIDLGLKRVTEVASRLNILVPAKTVITVAGTNGKGSTVAYYNHLLLAAGYTVGTYTSPHLLRYNERICINNKPLEDDDIVEAFDAIDQARGNITLTYFEFATLAALYNFKKNQVDFAILEVGLGGRLDAVNCVDADLVHFTPIGIDHTEWLGDTRELIAIEKAGVLRSNCKVICNDLNPTDSLLEKIKQYNALVWFLGTEYWIDHQGWVHLQQKTLDLNTLALRGEHQQLNCAGVLAGMQQLGELQQLSDLQITDCLSQIQFAGRYQTVKKTDDYQVIVDVGHNPDAAKVLVKQIQQQEVHRCVLILGMLADKNIETFVHILSSQVEYIVCLKLEGPRALSAKELEQRVHLPQSQKSSAESMSEALQKAEIYLQNKDEAVSYQAAQDIILITGSFLTVEAYLKLQ